MKKNPRIMMVDDELEIPQMMADFLAIENVDMVVAGSGEEALARFDDSIDLVVLDINMRGMSGREVCKALRAQSYVPIIFLTCNNAQSDILLGLGLGADDYVTKPFNPVELVARIKVNIRRSQTYVSGTCGEWMAFGDVQVHRKGYRVCKDGSEVSITPREFKLLLYLLDNAYIVLTRTQILTHVWGDVHYDENLVNTTIKRLRRRIETDPDKPMYIQTVRGVGYVFQGVVK